MGDASEFVAPWIDMALGLHKAAKYEGYRPAAALGPRLLKLRRDAKVAREITTRFTEQNAEMLRKRKGAFL